MRITAHTFVTLDGVMQGPGAPDEDRDGGFTAGGWLVPYADEDMGKIVEGWFARTDALLLGRTTYGLMAPYWSAVTDPDNLVARALNTGRKYVVSATLTDPTWGDTVVLPSLEAVQQIKDKDGGELQVHGSAGLVAALHAAGMIDEYRVLTFPVTVGAGKRLFPIDAPHRGYELVSSRATGAGATYAELRPTPFRGGGSFTVVDGKESVATT